jgi:cell division cycle protein 37
MEHVAHQAVVMNFVMELAKHLDRDPHSCVVPFFARMSIVDKEREYIDAFKDELNSFKQRVRERAKIRIEEALRQYEEEERKKRVEASPGGLDPQDVFDTLPEALKACFESQDIALLQQSIAQMDPNDAKYHIDRCVRSGLWVPGGGQDEAAEAQPAESAEQEHESDYDQPEEQEAAK